jgi:diguanylate cyclase (GGDEF)-like protein
VTGGAPELSALEALERKASAALERIRASGTDELLVQELLETSCLLELSQLTNAMTDVASYAQQAAEVTVQFLPLTGCTVVLAATDGTPLTCSAGSPVGAEGRRFALRRGGNELGIITFGPTRGHLDLSRAMGRIADQVAVGISVVLDTERLRRTAATETAIRLASTLSADDIDQALSDLVAHLAAWPGALAARLQVDHPAIGVPTGVEAGWWSEANTEIHPESHVRRDRAELTMRWASQQAITENPSAQPVLDALAERLNDLHRSQSLMAQVEIDPLTGLGNRRRLDRVLPAALRRATQQNESVAVLLFDLDNFKRVNDEFGHAVGDHVLRAVARVLSDSLRGYDEAVRLGGEEFLVITPSTDALGAVRLAERVRLAIPPACSAVLPEDWRQTISVGIASFPEHGKHRGPLLTRADQALYAAKRRGRDCVVLATEVDELAEIAGSFTEPPKGLRSFVYRLTRR